MAVGKTRALGLAIALTAAVAVLAGCGSDDETADADSGIATGTAEELARMSDGIADALEGGDTCDAAGRADQLRAAVSEAKIPAELRAEAMAGAGQLVNAVNCETTGEITTSEERDEDKQDEDKQDEEGRGSGPGSEGEGAGGSQEAPGHGGTPPGQVGKIKGGI